jgi:Domain of unknown function (DUF4145)
MKQAGFLVLSFFIAKPLSMKVCQTNEVVANAMLRCPNLECNGPVVANLVFRRDVALADRWNYDEVYKHLMKSGNLRFDMDHWRVSNTWPKAVSASIPNFLPDSVLRVFKEAETNKLNGAYESAAIMYGKSLDVATVKVGDNETEMALLKSLTLHNRIDKLGKLGKISGDLADWAKELKWARNDSTHDEEEVTKEDAEAIGEATRLILIYLFEMPARASELREKYNPKTSMK